MDTINLRDIETIMAYVSERNPDCAMELNNKLTDRITELHHGSDTFPSIGLLLSNDHTPLLGFTEEHLAELKDAVFLYIVDIGPDNTAVGCNTIFQINTTTGEILDRTDDRTTVH